MEKYIHVVIAIDLITGINDACGHRKTSVDIFYDINEQFHIFCCLKRI